jgi:predicted nucleotidyltransferase
MIVNRVFDEVFRTWSNVAVMRALLDTNNGFTGNEVARKSEMHPRSALKALTLLEGLGIVNRLRGGRDHIFTLNREHFIVQEAVIRLFDVESKFPQEIKKSLAAVLKNKVVCAVIFGSTARKEETTLSDLDICCTVKSSEELEPVRELLYSKVSILYKKYGIKLAPVFFTQDEFNRKKNTQVIQNIISEGDIVLGKLT